MSDVLTTLRTDVLTGLSVGSRVYPQYRPQGSALPALVFELIGENVLPMLPGTTNALRQARVQLHCMGERYADAAALEQEVYAALQDYVGDVSDEIPIKGAFRELVADTLDEPTDGGETVTHRRVAEYTIWYDGTYAS